MKYTALILTALTVFASLPAAAAEPALTEIQVTGNGSVSIIPDIASVDASIETVSDSSAEAVSRNNAIYERAVAALTKAGVARSDISLSSYNVNYNPKPQQPVPNDHQRYGFTVTRSFEAKTHALTKAGSIVDALVGSGVTNINGVSFDVADSSAARTQALRLAVDDARNQANALAEGAHLHITGIKTILYGSPAVRQPMPLMMAKAAAPTQLDPGSQDVSSVVTVTFLASP